MRTKSKWIRLAAAALLVLSLAAGLQVHTSAVATGSVIGSSSALERQAQSWVKQLSQKQEFESWQSAELKISSLGPGTHSWLVLVMRDNTAVGYLIMNAAEEGGYKLGEYGAGEYAPFTDASLRQSLSSLELPPAAARTKKLYLSPIVSFWTFSYEHKIKYADAYTGEGLPLEDQLPAAALQTGDMANRHGVESLHASIEGSLLLDLFDPYGRMPWLTKPPLPNAAGQYLQLQAALDAKSEVRYTAELFDKAIRYVWSVVGYDLWNGDQLYVALHSPTDDDNYRYIPYDYLAEWGSFYR